MSDFHYFVNALEQLKNTSSINEKAKILQDLKDNDVEIAKDFFEKALSPKYQFGLKQFPEYDISKEPDRPDMYHFVECAYTRLLEDKTDLKTFINSVLETLTHDEYELFKRICLKDPNCGVSAGLVNRTWNGLIDTGIYLCKAVAYSDKVMENIQYPCYVQKKEDGARCLAFVKQNGTVNLFSANGKPYTGLNYLENALRDTVLELVSNDTKFMDCDFVLDGELVVMDNVMRGTVLPRKAGNGILNKSIRGTISQKEADNVHFIMWDLISIDEYYGQASKKRPYLNRLELLHRFNDVIPPHFAKPFGIVFGHLANSKEEVIDEFKKQLTYGNEGIIVKNINFPWQGKRIKDCVKMKLDFVVTLEVKKMVPGGKGTKYENCLGALYCESAEGIIQVSVGSGFSDEFRKKFHEEYKDKPIENLFIDVRSNGLIQADDNTWSLFLPRFVEIRTDKDEADSAKMINELEQAALHMEY